jgi:hypothetical protein
MPLFSSFYGSPKRSEAAWSFWKVTTRERGSKNESMSFLCEGREEGREYRSTDRKLGAKQILMQKYTLHVLKLCYQLA